MAASSCACDVSSTSIYDENVTVIDGDNDVVVVTGNDVYAYVVSLAALAMVAEMTSSQRHL